MSSLSTEHQERDRSVCILRAVPVVVTFSWPFRLTSSSQGERSNTELLQEILVLHLQDSRDRVVIFLNNSNIRDRQKLQLYLGILDRVLAIVNKNYRRPLFWTKLLCQAPTDQTEIKMGSLILNFHITKLKLSCFQGGNDLVRNQFWRDS